jgi:hypothetical protein
MSTEKERTVRLLDGLRGALEGMAGLLEMMGMEGLVYKYRHKAVWEAAKALAEEANTLEWELERDARVLEPDDGCLDWWRLDLEKAGVGFDVGTLAGRTFGEGLAIVEKLVAENRVESDKNVQK